MFKKTFVVSVFLAIVANYTVFSQAVAIDVALSNATKEISGSVPKGTKIAVLNISSDYGKLSDYIIDELIANLVNIKLFQVVPRSTIELELAKGELDFQMTGDVSDDSQKRLGQFLGAGTIISGSITRDSANSYRIVVNTIDLESFTYQSSYRTSVLNNNQMKALIAGSGGVFYEDYTMGQRLGIGTLNIFGGVGSIINGQRIGWVTTATEGLGIVCVLAGLLIWPSREDYYNTGHYSSSGLYYSGDEGGYEGNAETRKFFVTAGSVAIGIGIAVGFVVPFFHHKPNDTSVSQNNFPLNFELVSSKDQNINGFRIAYNMKF